LTVSDCPREDLRATSIAIIGLAGRFPGAATIEAFWSNLVEGVESITFFSEEELRHSGVDPRLLSRRDFVPAAPVLDDIDQFDASFFKIARREAEIMDPQQRILLEVAWETLERAGYAAEPRRGSIGVFTGAGGLMSSYLVSPFHFHRRLIGPTGSMQVCGNDKDFVSTRISHKLNLRGPSISIQTACSTSLVAVHLACQSLLAGECDMALAGGVTVRVPHRMGYFHASQALLSPDGHCRAFDADAKGTLFGSGAGLVLLKPLVQAVADRDHIHAVIRGSAVNNDGAAKLSYWATSADGQAAAVAEALAVAEVAPETIGYVEAHGTGTAMGDPAEIIALTKAFRGTQKRQFCAIGSVKTNLGHLEAAAGIAGLIKAVLAVEHGTLPPSLHFRRANPAIAFEKTPFFVNTERRDWPAGATPRRAAVNSLGIGGTNVHVILEEAPQSAGVAAGANPTGVAGANPAGAVGADGGSKPAGERPLHVLALSAKSSQALKDLAVRFAAHLAEHPGQDLADVCFTANAGRSHFPQRLALTAASIDEARRRLADWAEKASTHGVASGAVSKTGPGVAMLAGGDGSQYPGMARDLYQTQPVFQKALKQCETLLGDEMPWPLTSLFEETSRGWLEQPRLAHPALVAVEYALAQLWKSWGIEPSAILGQGIGEYTAACLAGVFTLEEALRLVSARARLLESLPADGRMFVVLADSQQIAGWLPSLSEEVTLAAIGGTIQAVISGPAAAVESLVAQWRREGIRSLPLPGRHALYSPAMTPIVEPYRRVLEGVKFQKPRLKLISGHRGKAAGDEMASPDYWCRQLVEPMQFSAALAGLEERGYSIFLEISPKPVLLGVGRRLRNGAGGLWLPSLRPSQGGWQTMLTSLARLYVQGVHVDWERLDRGFPRRRVVLPTYPFQRQRYWIAEDGPSQEDSVAKLAEELKSTGGFSEEELRLLPKLLQALAARRRAPWDAE
jgi:acyl transferase domain-containing protein